MTNATPREQSAVRHSRRRIVSASPLPSLGVSDVTCSKQQSTVPAKGRETVLPPPPRSQTGSQHQRKIGVDRDTHPPMVLFRDTARRRDQHTISHSTEDAKRPAPFPRNGVSGLTGAVQGQ